MTAPHRLAGLSTTKLAYAAHQTAAHLTLLRAEPLAIVGLGCRFPGAEDVAAYWRLLDDGRDAVRRVPGDRWDAERLFDAAPTGPGKISSLEGGFLDAVDAFDPEFFGISPREAETLDPQQRLLLEVAWEGLESACIPADRLAGTATGIFVGIGNNDYGRMLLGSGRPERFQAHAGTGNALSATAGRLAYVLGTHGPGMAVDTACSSSLVAVHLACQSLRWRECDLALAGGVNLILNPDNSIIFSAARMLSTDGRCKTFDARADGYGRGEGCGVVVLKRLADALTAGDRIHAVIRGSAINHDGRSGGLTVPNGPAQRDVLRRALDDAGVAPDQVGLLETHGTGTRLGDPIEVGALSDVFGDRAADRPLALGAVKTNVGHLETAAGIAGLIKTVLALEHGSIPPNLHFETPNPRLPWDELPFVVPTASMDWPGDESRRIAGVSSFGFTGTNAHVVLEAAPVRTEPDDAARPDARGRTILSLSAATETGLAALARRHRDALARSDASVEDWCRATATGRARLPWRLSLPADSKDELITRLEQVADGRTSPDVITGRAREGARVAFLFTGQGAQTPGMGRALFTTEPVFRQAIETCDEILGGRLATRLPALLFEAERTTLADTAHTQPALFALEYALATLWRSWGIEPAAVIGHSLGEYVAACLAGVFDLESALTVVAARGRLMRERCPAGAMAAIRRDGDAVATLLDAAGEGVVVAAYNGLDNTVVSGSPAAVERLLAHCAAVGVPAQALHVSHAFHSPSMEPMLDEFRAVVAGITLRPPTVPLISNLTGRLAGDEITRVDRWVDHIRRPVQFARGLTTLAEHDCDAWLEVGPHPVLLSLAQGLERPPRLLASLRRGTDDATTMADALARLDALGAPIDWQAYHGERRVPVTDLPTYPFERRRFWLPTARAESPTVDVPSTESKPRDGDPHPLIDASFDTPDGERHVVATVGVAGHGYLDDHRVHGHVVLPGTAYLELGLAAGRRHFDQQAITVERFVVHQPLLLDDGDAQLHVVLRPAEDGVAFGVHSRPTTTTGDGWILHASGQLVAAHDAPPAPTSTELATRRAACTESVDRDAMYDALDQRGLAFGPRFRAVAACWRAPTNGNETHAAVGEIRLPTTIADRAEDYGVHPVLLDACFQVIAAASGGAGEDETFMLLGCERLTLHRAPGAHAWSTVHVTHDDAAGVLKAELEIYDADGAPAISVHRLVMKRVATDRLAREAVAVRSDWLFEVAWRAAPARPSALDLPAPSELHARLASHAAPADSDLAAYREVLPDLEQHALAHARHALASLGRPAGSDAISTEAWAEAAGVVEAHRRLFGRLLSMLAEVGDLVRTAEGWRPTGEAETSTPVTLNPAQRARLAPMRAELDLLERCGPRLATVLRGEQDGLEVLFPGGDATAVTRVYRDSPGARALNDLVRDVVIAGIESLTTPPTPERTLRVIELGAGTGGTTAGLLPALADHPVSYTYTDISPVLLTQAETRFSDHAFVDYRILDVEADPGSQGFDPGTFDLVVAANVLHATRDLAISLDHARTLLAPGGLLVVLEATAPLRWLDLVFGLTDGWWRFADHARRPDHALLTPAVWRAVLTDGGFDDPMTLSVDRHPDDEAAQSVLVARRPARSETAVGTWIVSTGDDGSANPAANGLTREIERRGGRWIRWRHGDDTGTTLAQALEGRTLAGVVHLDSLGVEAPAETTTGIEARVEAGCRSALALSRALLEQQLVPRRGTLFVTRGAVATGDESTAPAQAPLWGLGRTLALEHPELGCRCIDLDTAACDDAGLVLAEEITSDSRENQVAYRRGQRHVARLIAADPVAKAAEHTVIVRPDGAYVITGGLGDLGLLTADWLIENGARDVTLAGRCAPSRDAEARIDSWRRAGIRIATVAADVADADQTAAMVVTASKHAPLRGIVHAAGLLDDGLIRSCTWKRFRRVLGPKVAGAWNLHRESATLALDFFVLYSSATALLGSPGQANHVAACRFLDALAHHRRHRGLPATSIGWGPWSAVGEAARRGAAPRFAARGIGSIEPDAGRALLPTLFAAATAQVGVLPADWARFAAEAPGGVLPPFLCELRPDDATPVDEEDLETLRRTLATASARDAQDTIADYLARRVATVLRSSRDADRSAPLTDIGLDSLMAIELTQRVQHDLEVELPIEAVVAGTSIDALARDIAARHAVAHVAARSEPTTTVDDDVEVMRL